MTLETDINLGAITEALNGKIDLDAANTSNTGKSFMAGMAMPSNTYEDLTLGASPSTYTAPANGWFACDIDNCNFIQMATFEGSVSNPNARVISRADSNYSGSAIGTSVPVKKGDVMQMYYSSSGTVNWFRFIYAQGSESEGL